MLTLALIPIDNRPVSYDLAESVFNMCDDIKLLLPPIETLGDLTSSANIEMLFDWINSLEGVDYLVLSLDTLAYGGLVASRRTEDTFDTIYSRLLKLKQILKRKNIKVHAFSSIMRISNNNYNEEEKLYWDKYGEYLFQYSFNIHKGRKENSLEALEKSKYFSDKIAKEIIEDYLLTRERNFKLNKVYLDWAKEGFFSTLVFSKDDTGCFGLNVEEAEFLQNEIIQNNIKNAFVKTGADEIPLCLLSRCFLQDKSIKVYPEFLHPKSKNLISKYEDVSVQNSLEAAVSLSGGSICSNKEECDIVLFVNNFEKEQGDLVLGTENLNNIFFDFTTVQKPFFIADVTNANGADNNFVENFLKQTINKDNFLSYAGWNTTSNTIGSTCLIAFFKYLFSNSLNCLEFKKCLFVRFLDDWGYQTNIRKNIPYNDIENFDIQSFSKSYVKKLNDYFQTNFSPSFEYPWNRKFEIKISI